MASRPKTKRARHFKSIGQFVNEKGPFDLSQFVATKWATVEDKTDFANTLAAFVQGGCRPDKFTESLYGNLRNLFGHIAHYNIDGFRGTWFGNAQKRFKWIEYVISIHDNRMSFVEAHNVSQLGDPKFTWSDVERAIVTWLKNTDVQKTLEIEAKAEIEGAERAEFRRLQSKYGSPRKQRLRSKRPRTESK